MGKLVTIAQDTTSRNEQTGYDSKTRDQQTVYIEFEQAKVKTIVHNSHINFFKFIIILSMSLYKLS